MKRKKKSYRSKTRILSASSKIWKTSKYFDKDLRQVVLSAKKLGERLHEHKILIDKSLRFKNKNDNFDSALA